MGGSELPQPASFQGGKFGGFIGNPDIFWRKGNAEWKFALPGDRSEDPALPAFTQP